MDILRSYVIRVYRQESDGVAGVVESVETGDSIAFRSAADLWAVVSHPASTGRSSPFITHDQEEEK